jgi:hypothetical protein
MPDGQRHAAGDRLRRVSRLLQGRHGFGETLPRIARCADRRSR